MSRIYRVGVQINAEDPFWVLVRDAVYRYAEQQNITLIPLDFDSPYAYALSNDDQLSLVEELSIQEIDSIICQDWPETLAIRIIENEIPVIQLTESDFHHPLFLSPRGLYDIAKEIGGFLAQRLAGHGRVLVIGGGVHHLGEDGKSRIAGFNDALRDFPKISHQYLPSLWTNKEASEQIRRVVWPEDEHFDALFGFSDSIALAAAEIGHGMGWLNSDAIIVGINGDPLALASILNGKMTATVQTSATDLAEQAVSLALRAVKHQPLPENFSYKPYFVTKQNVSEIAAQTLIAIANLPSKLIGDNRQQAQQRLDQLETSLKISQQVGTLLDRHLLFSVIADLIRDSYGYDIVRPFQWHSSTQMLSLESIDDEIGEQQIPLDQSGLLADAINRHEPIFIPDIHHSHHFLPDPAWPDTRSRVIVPIRLSGEILGLLDLHSFKPRQHARQELIGLQVLADQLGIALRNSELYGEAVEARAIAEKADRYKTQLLANVSHELRTPLNIILGYTSTALASPNSYHVKLPPALIGDLQQVHGSSEHLLRVINDLLDLSRAEINELDIFPVTVRSRSFFKETFLNLTGSLPVNQEVNWRLDLPDDMPLIQADPMRLRQIIFNLLSNAHKFTQKGEIVLGAEVTPPHLHVWVKDTGPGIPFDLQERLFEPFVTNLQSKKRNEGIGLGLNITRCLVLLHGGIITLESQPGQGSTFHLYFPLPTLSGKLVHMQQSTNPALIVLSASKSLPQPIIELGHRKGWALYRAQSQDDLSTLLSKVYPAALAWDLANAKLSDWDFIQKIRIHPQLAQLPFILYGADRTNMSDSDVGLTDFLVKPLNRQSLIQTINALRPVEDSGPILIVDDDEQARELFSHLVTEAFPGNPIIQAEDGAVALKYLAEQVPALVILDLQMPIVDGFSVLESLRSHVVTRHVPVVVMSGRTLSFEDVQRLDELYVTFQSKDLLSKDETNAAFHRALASDQALPPQTSIVVKYAVAYLQQNYTNFISRQELASTVGVSKDYLSHIFHKELGLSPWEYLSRYRILQAKILLSNTHDSITIIAGQVGFDDLSYFNRVFHKHVGCSPGSYRVNSSTG